MGISILSTTQFKGFEFFRLFQNTAPLKQSKVKHPKYAVSPLAAYMAWIRPVSKSSQYQSLSLPKKEKIQSDCTCSGIWRKKLDMHPLSIRGLRLAFPWEAFTLSGIKHLVMDQRAIGATQGDVHGIGCGSRAAGADAFNAVQGYVINGFACTLALKETKAKGLEL